MKLAMVFLISLYQKTISIAIRNILGTAFICRYSESCSEYAKKSVLKHGVFKGMYLSIVRVLNCNPFLYEPSVTL